MTYYAYFRGVNTLGDDIYPFVPNSDDDENDGDVNMQDHGDHGKRKKFNNQDGFGGGNN